MNEGKVLRRCMEYLEIRRVLHWRSNNGAVRGKRFHGIRGVPDIIGILPGGRFLGVECKSDKGKQSPEQVEFQKKVEKLGGLYVLARAVTDLQNAGV